MVSTPGERYGQPQIQSLNHSEHATPQWNQSQQLLPFRLSVQLRSSGPSPRRLNPVSATKCHTHVVGSCSPSRLGIPGLLTRANDTLVRDYRADELLACHPCYHHEAHQAISIQIRRFILVYLVEGFLIVGDNQCVGHDSAGQVESVHWPVRRMQASIRRPAR